MPRAPTEASIAKKKLEGKKEFIRKMIDEATPYELEVVWIPRIIENQEADEITEKSTHHHNGMGLSAFDAEIVTSIYEQTKGGKGGVEEAVAKLGGRSYERRPSAGKRLTPKQTATIRKILKKYAGQFAIKMHSDFFLEKLPVQSIPTLESVAKKSVAAMSKSKRKI
jgi:hypothetical protein